MKQLLLLLFSLLLTYGSYGQLMITEIMYNPPESGKDSLEYIEIYNTTEQPIDLKNYKLKETNTYELPDIALLPKKYIVLGGNASALAAVLNINAFELPDLALSNSGEKIEILSLSDQVIDVVHYGKEAPWPTFADGASGAGASIELCNLDNDNGKGENWKASTFGLGVMVNGKEVKGTPGAKNTTTCDVQGANYTVEVTSNKFTPAELTIEVGESVQWVNVNGFHNVNGKQDVYPDNPESFFSGAPSSSQWSFVYTFTKPGTYTYQCDPHVGLGMVGTVIVNGTTGSTPAYAIGDINNVNENGVADSLGVMCKTTGIVHGTNLNGGGLQFALIDNEEGIGIYSQNDNFGYEVKEGDMVSVTGEVSQFNGLTQLKISAITLLSSNNELMKAREVEVLDETTESVLVSLRAYKFVDESQWKGDGSSFNVKMTNGTNTVALRIDNDSPLASMPIPQDAGEGFLVSGLGGQYDTSEPYTSGYQLFPRYASDFEILLNTVYVNISNKVHIYPVPASTYVQIDTEHEFDTYEIFDSAQRRIDAGRYTQQVDLSKIEKGYYILRLRSKDGTAVKSFSKL